MPVPHYGNVAALEFSPTITTWTRIEGRPRTANFDRALKAEVRDAVWMLARQFQLGEFIADDAGSPISARLMIERTRLTKYRAREGAAQLIDNDMPLEVNVERRPIPLPLNIRALLGRMWLKMIAGLGAYASLYIAKYPFAAPDPTSDDDATITAHPDVWQSFAAAAGRLMDGGSLYLYLRDPANRASDGVVTGAEMAALDAAGARFVTWVERLFTQPATADAWDPSRLEYRFACSAPERAGESMLVAREHHDGRLDWPSFEFQDGGKLEGVSGPSAAEVVKSEIRGLVPNPISFPGMPNTRWWAFEDGRTNFADIKPGATDIAKLMVMEFGLVYANDWFLIPCETPIGSLLRVRGLSVTSVFGERTWIEAAGRGDDDDWSRWSMFSINREGKTSTPADVGLLILPTTPKAQESEPFEHVYFFRDEMANTVWAVERTILSRAGQPEGGADAGHELRAWYDRKTVPATTAAAPLAPIRYQVMSATTPENWIPFLPVQVPDTMQSESRQIQQQRAAMPRFVQGMAKPMKIRPRTSLLREGLDQKQPYFIHEEEVPRSGTALRQTFQRTRWLGGRTYVWAGVSRRAGKGEGSSGLSFDQIVPTKS